MCVWSHVQEATSLLDHIPDDQAGLFAYPVDWATVDRTQLVHGKLQPWIARKIIEYLGEAEETLIQFVVGKLCAHVTPQALIDELQLVLDEDTVDFVMKLWRSLIYETLRATQEGR